MTTTPLLAYHGDLKIKTKYVHRVHKHFLADEIVKGKYWENGRGCGVGCTIHGSNHKSYEKELGIPEWLAFLEDGLFEHLPNEKAKAFPERFLKAIRPGADLSIIWNQFCHWLLVDPNHGVIRFADARGTVAIQAVADLHRNEIDGVEMGAASRDAAWVAAWAASRAAASDAAWVAAWAAASDAAWAAASAASWAASWDASRAAAWAAARAAAWAAASDAHYVVMADKIIELLEAA